MQRFRNDLVNISYNLFNTLDILRAAGPFSSSGMISFGEDGVLVGFDAASLWCFFLDALKANSAFVFEGLEVREESQIMEEELASQTSQGPLPVHDLFGHPEVTQEYMSSNDWIVGEE